jgi:hypothetical protein
MSYFQHTCSSNFRDTLALETQRKNLNLKITTEDSTKIGIPMSVDLSKQSVMTLRDQLNKALSVDANWV